MSYDSGFLEEAYLGNLTTLPDLQFRCRYTNEKAAEVCGVSPETYRRWLADRKPNLAAVKLMSILAGYVPWSGWSGWEVHAGLMFPPGFTRYGIGPGEIQAVTFYRQQISALRERVELQEREIRELRQYRRGQGLQSVT
jgi:DNA-binding transcriptional regulator YiaG